MNVNKDDIYIYNWKLGGKCIILGFSLYINNFI